MNVSPVKPLISPAEFNFSQVSVSQQTCFTPLQSKDSDKHLGLLTQILPL